MFHKHTFLFTLLLLPYVLPAQPLQLEWVVEYPCYAPFSLEYDRVATDSDGSIYLFGMAPESSVAPFGSPSLLTQKYDKNGSLSWEAKYSNEYTDRFRDYAFGDDGTIVVGGTHITPSFIYEDKTAVTKYDTENGELLWETFIFDTLEVISQFYDFELGDDNSIYTFGSYNDEGLFDSTKAYVAKLDHDTGDTLWTKTFPEMFFASEGKVMPDRLRVFGVPDAGPDMYIMDIDLDGNLLQSAVLPNEYFSLSIHPSLLFFDDEGFLISFGERISKWETSPDPIWSFDFSRGLPDMVGQAYMANVDESGNIYATGYVQDTITTIEYTQTIKLSAEGGLIWATIDRHTNEGDARFERGDQIAFSDHHVFVNTLVADNEDPSQIRHDYRVVLYSNDDGSILYDTLMDVNEIDVSYHAHYDSGHFYLLGRSYLSGSSEPEDYMYQLFQFKVDEPVSTTEEKGNQHAVHIYPNPANDRVTVEQPNGHFFDEIKWYDANGRLVFSDKIETESQMIKLPPLPTGLYSVQFKKGAAEYSEQLLIERP